MHGSFGRVADGRAALLALEEEIAATPPLDCAHRVGR